MYPVEICAIAFLCIFGSAIVGILVKDRLPEHHLSDESRTIIKAARSVVVGLAALTLGLLIATAKQSFDGKQSELKESTARMIVLNRLLLKDGSASEKARASLAQVAHKGIELIEKTSREGLDPKKISGAGIDGLMGLLLELPEQNANQLWIKNTALSLGNEITVSLWKIYQSASRTIAPLFLSVLIFWLMTIFFSLGLISPLNLSVLSALFTAAISMTGAILLTLEMDQPYGGMIQLTTEPLRMALQQFH